jgi:hypothetical protein
MRRAGFWGASAVLGAVLLFSPLAQSQPNKGKAAPRLEPVAETRFLMEGLADPNLRGLGKLLAERPKEAEAWGFARGQALLLAETGNLLMIRPPKNRDAQDAWMGHAGALREAASTLARTAAAKDYVNARAGLAGVANACNRCHQAFRVPTRVNPFPDAE